MRSSNDPTVLGSTECERLLRAGIFGRMALTTPGGPEIVPVNYRVVSDEILIRTHARTLLARWAHQAQVSFEVDLVDYQRWAGWSVVARGVAMVATLSALSSVDGEAADPGPRAVASPQPWADGERDALVRLPWTTLSGRQLGRGWDARAAMPVRTVTF